MKERIENRLSESTYISRYTYLGEGKLQLFSVDDFFLLPEPRQSFRYELEYREGTVEVVDITIHDDDELDIYYVL